MTISRNVSEDVWFSKMSVSQREVHVKRVLSVSLEPKVTAPKVSSLTTMNKALLQIANKNKNAPSHQPFAFFYNSWYICALGMFSLTCVAHGLSFDQGYGM